MNNEFEIEEDFLKDFDLTKKVKSDFLPKFTKPIYHKCPSDFMVKYDNAKKLAIDIGVLSENQRCYSIVAGSFIFGDFVEAYIVENNLKVKSMTITTLSMSQDNIDSLVGLVDCGEVEQMNLIISSHFYAMNRRKLIKYLHDKIKDLPNFTVTICGSHTKTCIFELENGLKYVMHGSANLRSSQNIEQFSIEENKMLYDFNYEYQQKLVKNYQITGKDLRVKKLFEFII